MLVFDDIIDQPGATARCHSPTVAIIRIAQAPASVDTAVALIMGPSPAQAPPAGEPPKREPWASNRQVAHCATLWFGTLAELTTLPTS